MNTPEHIGKKITVLAISGSLRANSSNNAVIAHAAGLVHEKVNFVIYEGLGSLPHFDDSKEPQPEVDEFRRLIREADGVLICSPEYAFGVPGSLKNAIDWTVSSGEFAGKPVALITAATGGDKAHAALLLTLTALSSHITEETTLLLPYIRAKMDENNRIKDPATIQAIGTVMDAFINEINNTEQ